MGKWKSVTRIAPFESTSNRAEKIQVKNKTGKSTDDGVFEAFPNISENFPKLLRRPDERSRTFSENFRKFPEDVRRFPKIAEDFRGIPEDVSMKHQRI